MIQEVDTKLRQLIEAHVSQDWAKVVFGSEPKDGLVARVLLYDVRENLVLRDELPRVGSDHDGFQTLKGLPPVRLDLSYLILAEGGELGERHDLLGQLLKLLYRNPFIRIGEVEESASLAAHQRMYVTVAQLDHRSHDRPDAVFRSLNIPLQPAVWVTVTAAFDIYTAQPVKLVRHALAGLGLITSDGDRPEVISEAQVSICGLVRAADRSLEGANVKLEPGAKTATTDSRGFFFFTGLPNARYKVTASAPGFDSKTLESSPPPPGRVDQLAPLDFTLAPTTGVQQSIQSPWGSRTVTIEGDLLRQDGTPAAYVVVRCDSRECVTDAHGHYRLAGLPINHGKLSVLLTGRDPIPVDVKDGVAKARI